jgi:hypothetical protein
MKQKRFKKWVEYTLIAIDIIAFLVLISEHNNDFIFITSKLIAMLVMYLTSTLLIKYTDILEV